MKWIGLVVAGILGFVSLVIVFSHAKDQEKYEAKLQENVDKEFRRASAAMALAEKIAPGLERKLAAEKIRAAGFVKQAQALETEQKALEGRLAELESQIEALSVKKEAQATKRQENTQQMAALQAKLTGLKTDVDKLQQLILTVTEGAELPK